MNNDLRLEDFMKDPLPPNWRRDPSWVWDSPSPVYDSARFIVRTSGRAQRHRAPLIVVVSINNMTDSGFGAWLHSSTSREGILPTWEELKMVKSAVHQDRLAIQLLPPESSWISVRDCLHLFERLDGETVPQCLWRWR